MNASSASARYAAIKRQQQRERDARPRMDEPCQRCGVLVPAKLMQCLCDSCRSEFQRIAKAQGLDAAEDWRRNR
jgi:Zn finger protein HypA/HybF involved in hydrogenase expression